MKPCGILFVFCFAAVGAALDLSDLKRELEGRKLPETVDWIFRTTVEAGGRTASVESHLYRAGEHRIRTEISGEMGRTVAILRDGVGTLIDLATGTAVPFEGEGWGGVPGGIPENGADLLERGRYGAPVDEGNGLFRVDLVPGSDGEVLSRSVRIDRGMGAVIGWEERVAGGSRRATLTYSSDQSRPLPRKVVIETERGGVTARLTVETVRIAFPKSLPEQLFVAEGVK